MDFKVEQYNRYNLPTDAKYSTCPICSEHRKTAEHRKQKCLMLDWVRGLGTCQHCGKVVQLHSYRGSKDPVINYRPVARKPDQVKQTSYIGKDALKYHASDYEKNNFVTWLISFIGIERTKEVISRYLLGTSDHFANACIFWQIDKENRIRAGKIMGYNPTNGKRIKQPKPQISWFHSAMKMSDYNLSQCFFGEHLINGNTKPIAIVESEKTAIVASVFLPDYIWLASGGATNLTAEKMKVLSGRNVTLFPDLGKFDEWTKKANELKAICNIFVSDVLEKAATDEERQRGFDLCDYLQRINIECVEPKEKPKEKPQPSEKLFLTIGDFIFDEQCKRIAAQTVSPDSEIARYYRMNGLPLPKKLQINI